MGPKLTSELESNRLDKPETCTCSVSGYDHHAHYVKCAFSLQKFKTIREFDALCRTNMPIDSNPPVADLGEPKREDTKPKCVEKCTCGAKGQVMVADHHKDCGFVKWWDSDDSARTKCECKAVGATMPHVPTCRYFVSNEPIQRTQPKDIEEVKYYITKMHLCR